MKQLDLVIRNHSGLHARPAKELVNLAKQYKSTIKIRSGAKTVNAKSMIGLLTLGVAQHGEIELLIDGEDELLASEALALAINAGLGEPVEPLNASESESTPADSPEEAAEPTVQEDGLVSGIPGAPGVAIGSLWRFRESAIDLTHESFSSIETETKRLNDALEVARDQLHQMRDETAKKTSEEEGQIFEAHIELLNDPQLNAAVGERIASKQPAPIAWRDSIAEQVATLEAIANETLAARAVDLRDVGQRLLRIFTGQVDAATLPDHPVILLAHDLTPSDTASLDKERILGICIAQGGPNAHTAILARALMLPAIVGMGDTIETLEEGQVAIIDGGLGHLQVAPSQAQLTAAREKIKSAAEEAARMAELAHNAAITVDGHHVGVLANIGTAQEAVEAQQAGAEGIGLLRTEFLFLGRSSAPDEEEQYNTYRSVLETFPNHPIVLRTLDIGGDKPVPYIEVEAEENPFLGERGIRLCLNRPELFRQQLRAVLRAAPHGDLRVMFPMVSQLSEWRAARKIISELQVELGTPKMEFGIMVEVPSTALLANQFAQEVDFFSIGTNDLTQYTLAVDRQHARLAADIDPLDPAVLRLIKMTVDAAHKAGKWVGVCGELAADADAVPLLVGLGVDELSVNRAAVARVKDQVRSLNFEDTQRLVSQLDQVESAAQIRQLLRDQTTIAV